MPTEAHVCPMEAAEVSGGRLPLRERGLAAKYPGFAGVQQKALCAAGSPAEKEKGRPVVAYEGFRMDADRAEPFVFSRSMRPFLYSD